MSTWWSFCFRLNSSRLKWRLNGSDWNARGLTQRRCLQEGKRGAIETKWASLSIISLFSDAHEESPLLFPAGLRNPTRVIYSENIRTSFSAVEFVKPLLKYVGFPTTKRSAKQYTTFNTQMLHPRTNKYRCQIFIRLILQFSSFYSGYLLSTWCSKGNQKQGAPPAWKSTTLRSISHAKHNATSLWVRILVWHSTM